MDKWPALHELLRQAIRDRMSVASYKRAQRALKGLEIPDADQKHALSFLGYVRSDTGEPYEWLARQLTAKK
jgi:hypothetical protein